jgi:hypothetical protein
MIHTTCEYRATVAVPQGDTLYVVAWATVGAALTTRDETSNDAPSTARTLRSRVVFIFLLLQ